MAPEGIQRDDLLKPRIHSLGWKGVSASTRQRRQSKCILSECDGLVKEGELLAIMGPSGCGKSTLLKALSFRSAGPGITLKGEILVNGIIATEYLLRHTSAYVEQADALVGALTIRETVDFASRLSHASGVNPGPETSPVEEVLRELGLSESADRRVGIFPSNGIHMGEKRRVSIASQMVTRPRILLLDEPTSGLDSAAAFVVMERIRLIAKQTKVIVVLSIHQPSTAVFNMFDQILLLSRGKTVYNGSTGQDLSKYLASHRIQMDPAMNPAEVLIDLINVDFERDGSKTRQETIVALWTSSSLAGSIQQNIAMEEGNVAIGNDDHAYHVQPVAREIVAMILLQRALLKACRDPLAYHVRTVMYLVLGLLMGTVWLRLPPTHENTKIFANEIFFAEAFLSFMAVAYIPAYAEDRAVFVQERLNGLYGPSTFLLCNVLAGIPHLLLMAVSFSIVVYWMSNFRPDGGAFFTWVLWVFLNALAAESLTVLATSIFPIFVIALIAATFTNGLLMCIGGFLVPSRSLNAFWRYGLHYVSYHSYVFQGMMVNEFSDRNLTGYRCSSRTDSRDECVLAGKRVLQDYGFASDSAYAGLGPMICIICGYWATCWFVLWVRRY